MALGRMRDSAYPRRVQRDSDEDAWRAIVENYGDRVELEDEPPVEEPRPVVDPALFVVAEPYVERPRELAPEDDDEDGFVPPEPPPLPKLPPDRLAAWAGLFGSPVVLLVCLVLGISLPHWAAYLLVAAFVGGFGYLVFTMPRDRDDPWDDGARL
jgi:hypothetical protein